MTPRYVANARLDAEDDTVDRLSWLVVLGLVTVFVWWLQ